MVTRSDKLAIIGPSLADLVLEIFCYAASPSFRGVATLVSKARQAVKDAGSSSPELAKDHSDLGKHITDVLTIKVKAARQQRLDLGVDVSLLTQAETAVAALISTDAEQDLVVLSAVRDPAGFENYLRTRAAKYRQQIEEQAEPYFDALVRAVAAAYVEIAPWSDSFVVIALKSLLGECTDIKEQLNASQIENRQLFSQILQLLQSLTEAIENLSKPSHTERVNFGSRPDVVAGDCFVPRAEQEQLNALIADPTRRRTVLMGMRGCGKTQLAATLAKQCEDANWNLVAWINAVSPDTIQSDLVELAKRLKIDTSDQPAQDVIVRRCLDHLKSAAPTDRLIVFDNVEDINHLTGLIPSGDGVRMVATTTNKVGWEDQGWNSIKVGVFDRSESINYLLTVTRSDDHDAADALAKRLGDLPLAIAQAAATARHKDLSLARYLKRLKSRGEELVIRPIPGDEYTVDAVKALLMAVKDTIKGLEGNTKETARRQLGALALLAESGVPTRWLDPTVEQLDDDESPDTQRDTDEDAHDALTELIHRSIVQQSADGTTIMLHRLQAQVLRENWDEKETAEAYESATILLSTVDVDRFSPDNTDLIDLIEQFAAMSTQHHSQQLFCDDKIRSCFLRALLFANALDLPVEPQGLANVVVKLEKILGSDHDDVVTARNCLAGAYLSAGYFPESINHYERVLTDRIRILGESDRSTLATRSDLASALVLAGHLAEAISQYKQVLDEQIRILGPEHVNTLATQHNLANVCFLLQKYTLAIPLYEQVLFKLISSQGPNDLHTLVAQSNLAFAYLSTGNLPKADFLYKHVLPKQIERHGASHHRTLTTRKNIATVYRLAGYLNKAIDEYETVLKDCTEALGTEHPLTVDVRENLEAARRELARQKGESSIEAD